MPSSIPRSAPIALLLMCSVASIPAATADASGVEALLQGQRRALIALAPFVLEFDTGPYADPKHPDKAAVARHGTLLAAKDGRFTVHQQHGQPGGATFLRENRAWDGNGLYCFNGRSDVTFFLPKAAFAPGLVDPVDILVARQAPMIDLLSTLGKGASDSANIAIPIGPLMVFDYLSTLDRYAAKEARRMNLRWCDIVDDAQFSENVKCVSELKRVAGSRVLGVGKHPSVPFRPGTFVDAEIVLAPYEAKGPDGKPADAVWRVAQITTKGPWQVFAKGLTLSEGDFTSTKEDMREVMAFTYDPAVAGGLLPVEVAVSSIHRQGVGAEAFAGQVDDPARMITERLHWHALKRFEKIDEAQANEAIDEYCLMQKQLVDISKTPGWIERGSATPAASSTK